MSKSMYEPDIAIVGAGPAGLGAALAARKANLRVTLIDDQIEPGGQIWRGAGSASLAHATRMGPEYLSGRDRVQEFLASGTKYLAEHSLWQIEYEEDRPVIYCAGPNGGQTIKPDVLLLATGALERPVPIPGWTLPGVMTAGGLQILLKTAQLSSDNAVLAGAGPLLWLIASQMVNAGTPPKAVVECVELGAYFAAARYLPSALRNPNLLKKGLGLIGRVQRAGVPVYRGARNLRVEGDLRARTLCFENWRGRKTNVDAEIIGLHTGVVPNQQASRLLRLPHSWDDAQLVFSPDRDENFKVSDRIYIAGDGARIGGAEVAWTEGQIVGSMIAGNDVVKLRRSLTRAEAIRPFIDRLYKPAAHLRLPSDDTVLCRCEAVTAGRVRQAVRDGAMGPNQVKFMLRPGMGPCQGRVCGLAVSEVVAETMGQDMQETGYFRIRPPLKPIPLGVIATKPCFDVDFSNDETSATKKQAIEKVKPV